MTNFGLQNNSESQSSGSEKKLNHMNYLPLSSESLILPEKPKTPKHMCFHLVTEKFKGGRRRKKGKREKERKKKVRKEKRKKFLFFHMEIKFQPPFLICC